MRQNTFFGPLPISKGGWEEDVFGIFSGSAQQHTRIQKSKEKGKRSLLPDSLVHDSYSQPPPLLSNATAPAPLQLGQQLGGRRRRRRRRRRWSGLRFTSISTWRKVEEKKKKRRKERKEKRERGFALHCRDWAIYIYINRYNKHGLSRRRRSSHFQFLKWNHAISKFLLLLLQSHRNRLKWMCASEFDLKTCNKRWRRRRRRRLRDMETKRRRWTHTSMLYCNFTVAEAGEGDCSKDFLFLF